MPILLSIILNMSKNLWDTPKLTQSAASVNNIVNASIRTVMMRMILFVQLQLLLSIHLKETHDINTPSVSYRSVHLIQPFYNTLYSHLQPKLYHQQLKWNEIMYSSSTKILYIGSMH